MAYTVTFGNTRNAQLETFEGETPEAAKGAAIAYMTGQGLNPGAMQDYTLIDPSGARTPFSLDQQSVDAINAFNQSKASPEQVSMVSNLTGAPVTQTYDARNTAAAQTGPFTSAPSTGAAGPALMPSPVSSMAPTAATTTPPAPASITNPITPPTTVSAPTPTFPQPAAGSTNGQYSQSVAGQTEATKAALQAEADKRAAEYDVKIKALEQKDTELQQLQDAGMVDLKDTVFKESAEKRAELELEKKRFDENYNAVQQLVGELDGLLTEGNAAITEMENTTGLASIMNPRIAKKVQDVNARAGVINAVISARNGQMSQAQNQLGAATAAISSIYSDEIDYYKTVLNYYGSLKDENNNKILNLTKDQRQYADMRISLLENDLNQLQATRAAIEKAMLDPDTALMYAKAGVTLNDSVESINRKIATYQYQQEVANISNTMTQNGYSTTPVAGAQPVAITDSQGTVRNYYKAPQPVEAGKPGEGQYTLGTNDVRFDADGNVIAVGPAPEPAAPTSAAAGGFTLAPGNTRYDSQGNPIATAPQNTTTAAAEGSKLLSPAEVKSLQDQGYTKVTYGMTRDEAAATLPKPAPSGYPTVALQPGSTNTQAVMQLQDWLVANGYMTQAEVSTGYGTYGPKTTAAVTKMQQDRGIDNSSGPGYFGPKTIANLQGAIAPPSQPSSGGSTAAPKDYAFASAGDKSKVLQYASSNPSIDQTQLKTDQDYFYWVLSQANASSSGGGSAFDDF